MTQTEQDLETYLTELKAWLGTMEPQSPWGMRITATFARAYMLGICQGRNPVPLSEEPHDILAPSTGAM